ncbi:hypothetical protein Dimus_035892 [Dionaea muscipula]
MISLMSLTSFSTNLIRESFSTGNGRKPMPRFDISSDYHNITTRNTTTGGQNLMTPHESFSTGNGRKPMPRFDVSSIIII